MKTSSDVPTGAQKSLTEVLTAPQHNVGKDEYIVDLESDEKLSWLGTESGLLGAFGFEGAFTVGDDSYDPPTKSMGVAFCNFNTEEGLSSNRTELVALRECLEAHDDHIDLLYLTDTETTLQAIHKWIGGGSKLNLSRSSDADVLKVIILKLQKRVEAGAITLLIKVKDHRGDPLNEEADIRAELGRLKEYKEMIWNDSSDRTVYELPVTFAKHGGGTVLKTSVWFNSVSNYIRQKVGEIETYEALEIGTQKWCKEHILRNGNDLTEEGQILLEDPEL